MFDGKVICIPDIFSLDLYKNHSKIFLTNFKCQIITVSVESQEKWRKSCSQSTYRVSFCLFLKEYAIGPPCVVGRCCLTYLLWDPPGLCSQKEYEQRNIMGNNKEVVNCTFLLYSHKQTELGRISTILFFSNSFTRIFKRMKYFES